MTLFPNKHASLGSGGQDVTIWILGGYSLTVIIIKSRVGISSLRGLGLTFETITVTHRLGIFTIDSCLFFFRRGSGKTTWFKAACVCVCVRVHACVCVLSHIQLFCDLMACSLPRSSVHGIVQARILEWVAISFSRGSSDSGTRSGSPTSQADSLPLSHLQSRWALRAAERKVDYSEESVRTISWSFGAKCKLAFQRSPAGSKISV